jgi:hypothetical protein
VILEVFVAKLQHMSQRFSTVLYNSFKPIITMTSICPLGSFQQPDSSDDSFNPAAGSCDHDLCCDLRLGTMGICQDY